MSAGPDRDASPAGQIPDAYLVGWHEAECGQYRADLPLWRRLAGAEPRRILDLGCGSGRVATDLAELGHQVTGLDIDPRLLAAIRPTRPPVRRITADARDFELPDRYDLVLAPMQFLQLFTERRDRLDCLGAARRHLVAGGRFAAALVDFDPGDVPPGVDLLAGAELDPDIHEIEPGLLATSTPTGFKVDPASRLRIERRREIVALDPDSDRRRQTLWTTRFRQHMRLLDRETFADELDAAGLRLSGWQRVEATDRHMASLVAVAEAV